MTDGLAERSTVKHQQWGVVLRVAATLIGITIEEREVDLREIGTKDSRRVYKRRCFRRLAT